MPAYPQCSLLLLKHCHVPKLNSLSRTVSPENLLPSAVIHDRLTKDCFQNILNLNPLDYKQWYQATLKVKLGGFGLTSTESICHAAYLATWARSLHKLPERDFPVLLTSLMNIYQLVKQGLILHELVAQLPSKSNSEEVKPQFHSLQKMVDYRRKLQYHLTLDISQKPADDFIRNIKPTRNAASLRSLQGKGARAWLDVIIRFLLTYKNALKPNEFRLASCMRLGISLPSIRLRAL